MTISHPNARACWVEIDVDASGPKTVLMVETDLELDQSEPDYDATKVRALIDDVNHHRAASGYLDAVRITRNWKYAHRT